MFRWCGCALLPAMICIVGRINSASDSQSGFLFSSFGEGNSHSQDRAWDGLRQ